ncbi:MAG: urea transporter ATP-binding subunit UrtE [Thermomicrobiales bacterium]|nr:urea transporter ATP-binding subunit UrtE [Thermomicrobiales bacterium]MCD6057867.1 urea transporter ATP-binding subunit UrtE [Thermomicrobiales bacterium]MDF3016355.1 urea transporter ATP-binding subunit UrtE [Thermomicrobiales bacterium]
MLTVTDVWAAYGQTPVLLGTNLRLEQGEMVTLLGRNGVGKTTLLRAIMGMVRVGKGAVTLDGRPITGLAPYRVAAKGISYIPQGRGIFPRLTVEENLRLGTKARPERNPTVPPEVFDYFPILRERSGQRAGTLSGGEQQMLAIGRGMAAKPRIMLLDEPSEGIQPNIVHRIGDVLSQINDETGMTILLVEQNLDLGLSVAARCVIMEKGQVAFEGTSAETGREEVIKRYLAV